MSARVPGTSEPEFIRLSKGQRWLLARPPHVTRTPKQRADLVRWLASVELPAGVARVVLDLIAVQYGDGAGYSWPSPKGKLLLDTGLKDVRSIYRALRVLTELGVIEKYPFMRDSRAGDPGLPRERRRGQGNSLYRVCADARAAVGLRHPEPAWEALASFFTPQTPAMSYPGSEAESAAMSHPGSGRLADRAEASHVRPGADGHVIPNEQGIAAFEPDSRVRPEHGTGQSARVEPGYLQAGGEETSLAPAREQRLAEVEALHVFEPTGEPESQRPDDVLVSIAGLDPYQQSQALQAYREAFPGELPEDDAAREEVAPPC